MGGPPRAAGAAWLVAAALLLIAAAAALRADAPRCESASAAAGRPNGPAIVRCMDAAHEGTPLHASAIRPCTMGPPGLVEAPVEASNPIEGRRLKGAARLLFGLPLDLNSEVLTSFEALPGVGPSRAQAIGRARGERPFVSIEDLRPVEGFGARTRGAIARCVEVTRTAGR